MKSSLLQVARATVIILSCGIGVAGTSREMHKQSVEPYYVKLAVHAQRVIDHTKDTIAKGDSYVRGMAK